ncbi:MAG TPA: hypothetical protein VNC84_05105 [Gammaproteobacteria bacterium]|jgi:hypothetical protein|nr:hypothetical protein [Gammaproteobacteria bacterium]
MTKRKARHPSKKSFCPFSRTRGKSSTQNNRSLLFSQKKSARGIEGAIGWAEEDDEDLEEELEKKKEESLIHPGRKK